MSKKNISRDEH